MSNVSPPPPSSFPPPPPSGLPPTHAGGASLSAPSGLRTATVALFGLASVLSIALGVAAYQRGGVARRWRFDPFGQDRIDAADSRAAVLLIFTALAQLAAAIVLCLWSYRTVRNAAAKNPAAGLSPGLACGGWFIPIGNLFVPWMQLRKAAATRGAVPAALLWWQVLFIAQLVLFAVSRPSFDSETPTDELVRMLHRQGVVFALAGVAMVVCTVLALYAMRAVDEATSGTTA